MRLWKKELNKASTDICYDGRRFIPKMNSENGKMELSEQWEWTSGECSKGESLLMEV